MNGYWYSFRVDKRFIGKSISDFLAYFKQSKKNRYLLFLRQHIQVNQCKVKEEYILQKGDELQIFVENQEVDFVPDAKEAKVQYEDDIVLVVHKDPGILVHEDDKTKTGTLANQVATYYHRNKIQTPVRYIHRLDVQTQGLVCFVKIPFFQPIFDEMLSRKEIARHYKAIVWGEMEEGKSFTIHKPIGRNRHNSKQYLISSSGKDAITHVKVLKSKNGFSEVECVLETGRTHQIRVHLSSIGHPIVNDEVYGKKSSSFKHMGLWAYQCIYTDPITQKKRVIEDSFNSDFSYFK